MKRSKNKRIIKNKLVLLILLLIIPILIISSLKLLKIRNIECRSQFGACSELIKESLNTIIGKDYSSTRKNIVDKLKNNLYIEKYSINFKFPDKAEIYLIIRKPYYSIRNEEGYFLVSKDGFVVSKSGSSSLPNVELENSISVGDKLNENQLFALKVVSDIFSLYKIKSSILGQDSLSVELDSGTKAIFPLAGDEEVLIGAFIMIYEQLNSNGEIFRIDKALSQITIDLRYKNPVIR